MSTQSEFTNANVVAMYLALGLSILTQPYGSLVYDKPKSILGKVIFYFWRLSPVACMLETLLIFAVLLYALFAPSPDWHTYNSPPHEDDWRRLPAGTRLRLAASSLWTLRAYDIRSHRVSLEIYGHPIDFELKDFIFAHSFQARLNALYVAGHPLLETGERSTTPTQTTANGDSPGAVEAAGQTPSRTNDDDRRDLIRVASRVFVCAFEPAPTLQEHVISGWKVPEWSAGAVPVFLYGVKILASDIPLSISIPALMMAVEWLVVGLVYLACNRQRHQEHLLAHMLETSAWLEGAYLQQQLLFIGLYPSLLVITDGVLPKAPNNTANKYAMMTSFAAGTSLGLSLLRQKLRQGAWFLHSGNESNTAPAIRPISHVWRRFRTTSRLTVTLQMFLCIPPLAALFLPLVWVVVEAALSSGSFVVSTDGLSILLYIFWNISIVPWSPLPSENPYREPVGDLPGWWTCGGICAGLIGMGCYVVRVLLYYDSEGTYKPGWIEWLP